MSARAGSGRAGGQAGSGRAGGQQRAVGPALAGVLAGALAVAACTAGDARPRATLPAAVTFEVEVAQARTDRVARIVQLQVRNTGPLDVTVTRARLTGTSVGGATDEGRVVEADRMRRLRVPLDATRCDGAPDADPGARVALDVTTADGRAGTVVVTPTDETDDLRRIRGEDCARAAVAAGLDVRLSDELTVREVDGDVVADLTLLVRPVPGGPHVRLTAVRSTTLLRPPGADVDWAVDVDSAAPPADGRVVLPVVPARCDLHAIAEDKRGTVLGLRTEVDGVPQPVFHVAASDALRGALYEVVLAACGHPTGAGG